MHVHLIGVCGTGMGAFAGLLKQAGHRVTGSDTAFYPPMGDALRRWGIETLTGFSPDHLSPAPDLVVIGNVCRPSNPEARAAIDGGLRYTSFPGALRSMFLDQRRSFVIAGTHGKTTTSALLAFLLDACGRRPGFLFGGVAGNFAESFRSGEPGGPFVVEGDEYDSAFFEKTPKFWQYVPKVAVITALEHDHIDIYPDLASYRDAFRQFVQRIAPDGLLVLNAADPELRALAEHARCTVRSYALEGQDTGGVSPEWLAAPAPPDGGAQPFDLYFGGSSCGRVMSPLAGLHNVANTLAAFALAAEGFAPAPGLRGGAGVAVRDLVRALPRFTGVRRRQELRGTAAGVRVYDDFAHHPTAVDETLRALRGRHPQGRLFAVFEPRSSTASRKLHEAEYARAFGAADVVLLAPVGRPEIDKNERLDVESIAAVLRGQSKQAEAPASIEAIIERLAIEARSGDTVVIMSNGAFGDIHNKLLARLAVQLVERRLP